ncbi:protein of unknown function [Candidatus Filomicrobium marinum]|uniref:Uncharacterized protein n=1 Tax=Candidatus Filomicrobium marinum TaxID=1608628 RepID=A0A0D6JJN2_9HYPH|nr:protein of unknown function [Candidatus Filomicrobium marinum]CPR21870.1 protein of unknown function [Candidatus Filomicrobium marinum]
MCGGAAARAFQQLLVRPLSQSRLGRTSILTGDEEAGTFISCHTSGSPVRSPLEPGVIGP